MPAVIIHDMHSMQAQLCVTCTINYSTLSLSPIITVTVSLTLSPYLWIDRSSHLCLQSLLSLLSLLCTHSILAIFIMQRRTCYRAKPAAFSSKLPVQAAACKGSRAKRYSSFPQTASERQ